MEQTQSFVTECFSQVCSDLSVNGSNLKAEEGRKALKLESDVLCGSNPELRRIKMNIEIDMDDNIENAVQHWMEDHMKDLVTEELKDCDSLKEEVDERLDEALSEHDTVRDLIERLEELEARMKGLEQERPLDLTKKLEKLVKDQTVVIAALKLW